MRGGIDITSMGVIKIREWFVKVSTTSLDSICVVMTHSKLGYTKVAFFVDEVKAHVYISSVTNNREG
jgi:hypothetical protein